MFESLQHSVVDIKKSSPSLFHAVCGLLVVQWLQGRVGKNAPVEAEEIQLVREANKQELDVLKDVPKNVVICVYMQLIDKGCLVHLQQVASHRNWIRWTHQFLVLVGVPFNEEMERRVKKHDLSKFSSEEILGYGIMFGEGKGFRKIEDADEQKEWMLSLEHHYQNNPHHPEYFYANQNGNREKVAICRLENGLFSLQESIIDMLACRGERELKDDSVISAEKWLTIADVFLRRYSDEDRQYVVKTLIIWKEKAVEFVRRKGSPVTIEGGLSGKQVVA